MTPFTPTPARSAGRYCRALLFLLCCHSPWSAASADTLAALVFAAEALPGQGAATPAPRYLARYAGDAALLDSQDLKAARRAHEAALLRIAEEAGPYAPALGEHHLSLGRLHQQAGEHTLALEQFAKAEHNIRVNEGLKAAALFVPVRLGIDSLLATREFQQAIERQEYLVHLHQAYSGADAVDVVPVLAALGDMYFAAFERGIHREGGDGELVLRSGPESGFRDGREPSAMDVAFLRLRQAQTHYYDSIKRLLVHERYSDPLLLRLETLVIETLFLQSWRSGIELDPRFFLGARDPQRRDTLAFDQKAKQLPGYRDGVKAFKRILTYLHHNPQVPPEQVAAAMLELGDWHLLFNRNAPARQQYAEARAYLEAHAVPAGEIEALLSPAVPVQLPTFLARPHSAGENRAVDYTGYIDVALTLDRNGHIARIEVLDKSPNAEPEIEARLKKVLRNAPFRPRLALAEEEGRNAIALRYNFGWL